MSRVSAAESVQGATKFPKVKRVGRGSAPNLARKMGKAAESADTRPIRWFAYWWHPLVPAIFTIEGREGTIKQESPMPHPDPQTGKAEVKAFAVPDEVREFPKGRLELIKIGGATIGRAVFEPGWRWATSVQPLVNTKSCEAPHFQYHVSGVLRIRMDDGSEFDCKPGDVSLLPSGHDAWVVGEEPAIVVDFQGMVDYAKAGHAHG